MKFIANQVYHIFNQGNNKRLIFHREANYLYFLDKMRHHLIPYVDVIAYCLMPNHFHWLVRTKTEAVLPSNGYKPLSKIEMENMMQMLQSNEAIQLSTIEDFTLFNRQQNLCHEIGICLGSYSRAINRQQKSSGSLFRKRTKAKDGSKNGLEYINASCSIDVIPDLEYQKTCFNYIHENPVKAGLVDHAANWPFSSAVNYLIHNSSDLCQIEVAEDLGILSTSATTINE